MHLRSFKRGTRGEIKESTRESVSSGDNISSSHSLAMDLLSSNEDDLPVGIDAGIMNALDSTSIATNTSTVRVSPRKDGSEAIGARSHIGGSSLRASPSTKEPPKMTVGQGSTSPKEIHSRNPSTVASGLSFIPESDFESYLFESTGKWTALAVLLPRPMEPTLDWLTRCASSKNSKKFSSLSNKLDRSGLKPDPMLLLRQAVDSYSMKEKMREHTASTSSIDGGSKDYSSPMLEVRSLSRKSYIPDSDDYKSIRSVEDFYTLREALFSHNLAQMFEAKVYIQSRMNSPLSRAGLKYLWTQCLRNYCDNLADAMLICFGSKDRRDRELLSCGAGNCPGCDTSITWHVSPDVALWHYDIACPMLDSLVTLGFKYERGVFSATP